MSKATKKLYHGVMVSSTFMDLEQHRAALMLALQKEKLHPVGMETHIAKTTDNIISSSLDMVEESSAYIGLISHRYGQIIEDDLLNPNGYSITRLEYEKAQSLGLPTLIFIMDEEHQVKKTEVEIDPEKIKKLEEFREEAKNGRIYNEFKDLGSFSRDAGHLVAQLRREIEKDNLGKGIDTIFIESNDINSIPHPPELYAQPPYIGSHNFVGRATELQQLNDWASRSDPHPVLLFEAIGGSGKSMLTWEWVKNHASITRKDWAGKFWYSFYERGAQMSDFCRHALAYMTGKPFAEFEKEKTPKMAELLLANLRAKPWLLILDGLERVLVAYNRIDAAEIPDEELNQPTDKIIDRDPRAAIRPEDDDLLHALASANPSKILVSSRLIPKVLINQASQPIVGVQRISLTGLRPTDAEALIRSCGVSGDSQKIQDFLSSNCACHPLVIGVLAGLIIDFLPAKGNFDSWVDDSKGGRKLNLGKLDLIQKRNHILKAAFDNLTPDCRQLLSILSMLTDTIDYPTLCEFSPHIEINENGVYSNNEEKLQKTVKDLEVRGFLQYDGKYHNLHPVVRGVVAGSLQSEERLKHGQKVVDYFSQKAHTPYEDVETLEDISDALHVITTLQKMGKFQLAMSIWRGELSNALFFNLEANNEILAILKPFFPDSLNKLPSFVSRNDADYLINDLAIVMSDMNELDKALLIQFIRLENNLIDKDFFNARNAITAIANIFSRMNRLVREKKYHEWAIELSQLIEREQDLFIARYHYSSFLIDVGLYDKLQNEWLYFEKFKNQIWSRAVYRPGDLETTFCNYKFKMGRLSEEHLEQAERISTEGKNRSAIRTLLFIRGMWYIEHQNWEMAIQSLNKEIEMTHEIGEIVSDSEILLALAKANIGVLQDPKSKAIELSKTRNPDHLFLAELFEYVQDKTNTEKHAVLAYRKYWGDGEPFVYRYFLERTKKLLDRIGVAHPILPPYDLEKEEKYPVEDRLIKALEKLRKEKATEKEEN